MNFFGILTGVFATCNISGTDHSRCIVSSRHLRPRQFIYRGGAQAVVEYIHVHFEQCIAYFADEASPPPPGDGRRRGRYVPAEVEAGRVDPGCEHDVTVHLEQGDVVVSGWLLVVRVFQPLHDLLFLGPGVVIGG